MKLFHAENFIPDLKDCPCCGGAAQSTLNRGSVVIHCAECSLNLRMGMDWFSFKSGDLRDAAVQDVIDMVTASWNMRTD